MNRIPASGEVYRGDGTLINVGDALEQQLTLLAAILLGLAAPPAASRTILGYADLSVAAVVVPLPTIPPTCNAVWLALRTGEVRWRGDGGNPTSGNNGVGMWFEAAHGVLQLERFPLVGLQALRFVRGANSTVTMGVTFLRVT